MKLLDERSDTTLRETIGGLLADADTADIAVTRIRLGHMDLTRDEVTGPRRVRVLLGHLDAGTLLDAGGGDPAAVARLAAWARSGRLAVRSAGIGAWSPDFSVYHERPRRPDLNRRLNRGGEDAHRESGIRPGTVGNGAVSLVGAHYFGNPYLTVGPSFTAVSADAGVAALLTNRFDELWDDAHDVLPAILDVLERVVGADGAVRVGP